MYLKVFPPLALDYFFISTVTSDTNSLLTAGTLIWRLKE